MKSISFLFALSLSLVGCAKRVDFAKPLARQPPQFQAGYAAGAKDAAAKQTDSKDAAYAACVATIQRVGELNVQYHKELDKRKN